MARKRIIAYFMHEYEEQAALQYFAQPERTESYLVGDVEEKDLDALKKQGLIIQVIDEQPEIEPPETGATREPAVAGRGAGARGAPARPDFYAIRLSGPVLEHWRGELEKRGVVLLESTGRYRYTARLTDKQAADVRGLPFVRGVRPFSLQEAEPSVPGGRAPEPPVSRGAARAPRSRGAGAVVPQGAQMLTFDVRLHRPEDLEQAKASLEGMGVKLAGASGRKIRVYLLDDATLDSELQKIHDTPEVAHVEPYVPPRLHNDVARVLLGVDPPANPGVGLGLDGAGEIVGVADTGLDDLHPDFQGRIVGVVALGRPGDSSDPHGHGTHVAGSVLGDGTASGGGFRGAAPAAQLYFQSLLDPTDRLGGLPLDLNTLFDQAYQAGARIHNNSWGSIVGSEYTMNSLEVDEFVASHRDMLIVISAGNEGQAANRRNSQLGFVDWLSIGAPASSKNGLTVGASRSTRTAGGYSTLTYSGAWPAEFPDAPIGAANVSGDRECLAGFSSRGPCTDRRIKPDVVAPGTDIASAKSSRAPLHHFWGPVPGQASYAFMGGTSMAAPLVAGCAALVRQYYVQTRGHQPSAALLKATLINGTRRLSGADAVADHPDLPNFHQGFGCVDMSSTIPSPRSPALRLEFLDPWQDPTLHFNLNGQRLRRQITVTGGSSLRICLTWTDPAARALQNNLNLFVQFLPPGQPPGQKWIGNENLPLSLGIPDPENNIEIVRLENPAAGDYLIQISASNLLSKGQDFALVVSGELGSPIRPYP